MHLPSMPCICQACLEYAERALHLPIEALVPTDASHSVVMANVGVCSGFARGLYTGFKVLDVVPITMWLCMCSYISAVCVLQLCVMNMTVYGHVRGQENVLH